MTERDTGFVSGDEDTADGRTLPRARSPIATLASPASGEPDRPVDDRGAPLAEEQVTERYAVLARLGEGGMGEVHLCLDRRIGRDVAMKVVHPNVESNHFRGRFEREARIQGQLDHPAVVPVYDLGLLPDGTAFFTMKRVRGLTLADVLARLAERDPAAAAQYTQRRLLAALSSVSLALAFAHDRGVVHRDIKPDNIMLGAYGEVYLLDWGIAKLGARPSTASSAPGGAELQAPVAVAPAPRAASAGQVGTTQASPLAGAGTPTSFGELLGTPGYMAPEQVRGDPAEVDARADVYALGVVLFEVLAGCPLVAPTTARAMFVETLKGVDARPSVRAPERAVAPELEAICVTATALDRDRRFASARDLHDALERYLDGDRDVERRRAMAEEHAARAEAALAASKRGAHRQRDRRRRDDAPGAGARDEPGGLGAMDARAVALQEATSALTLDPSHTGARATLMRVLLTVPDDMPPDARAALAATRAPIDHAVRRSTVVAYLVWLLFSPLAIFTMGVRSWPLFLATPVAVALGVAAAIPWLRRGPDSRLRIVVHVFGALGVAFVSLQFSPFLLVPSLAAALTIAFVLFGDPRLARLWALLGGGAFIVPWLLEAVGILPPSIVFRDGNIVLLPRAIRFPEGPTTFFLVSACLTLIVGPMIVLRIARRRVARAEERLFHHAWTLEHLVPKAPATPAP